MRPDTLDTLIAVFLAAWFVAIVIYQIFLPRFAPWASRFDVFRVVPGFHLHTGIPAAAILEYRNLTGGVAGPWTPLLPPATPPTPSSLWLRAIWNPNFCVDDELLACARAVSNSARKRRADLTAGPAFRSIARYLASLPPAPAVNARQFRVVWPGRQTFESEPIPCR